MNILVRLFTLLIFVCFATSCSKRISIVPSKQPSWVSEKNGGERDSFSAVSSTNKKKPLRDILYLSENDALDKVRRKLVSKIGIFLNSEIADLDRNKKMAVLNEANDAVSEVLTVSYLKSISRRDEFWKDPRTSISYVRVIVDRRKVSEKVVYVLEKLQRVHMHDNDVVIALNKAKSDIISNDFEINVVNANNGTSKR